MFESPTMFGKHCISCEMVSQSSYFGGTGKRMAILCHINMRFVLLLILNDSCKGETICLGPSLSLHVLAGCANQEHKALTALYQAVPPSCVSAKQPGEMR